MKGKRGTTLRDWSFLIFLLIFGCVYTAVFGFPLFGEGEQLQIPLKFALFSEKEQGNAADTDMTEEPEKNDTAQIAEEQEPAVSEEAAAQPEAEDTDITEEPEKNIAEEPEKSTTEGDMAEASEKDTPEDPEEPAPEDPEGTVAEDPEETEKEIVYQTVEDDYFADAVFLGDSRTVGMYAYGGLEGISTFGCSKGLTVYKMFDSPIVDVPGQITKLTVEELLSQRQFSAVYLMIGINEMGAGDVESFIETYKTCVDRLRELQPQAVIYLQSIMRVTEERSAKGDYITNEGINARNEEIAKMADGKGIFYLDVNPVVCDETGGMIKDYTTDGVHLKAKHIALWKDYLKCHVVRQDEIG